MTQVPPPHRSNTAGPYGQPPAGAPQTPPKVRPSAAWYILAAALFVGGLAAAVPQAIGSFFDLIEMANAFAFAEAPDDISYTCPEAGTYAVYFVGPDAPSNRRRQSDASPYDVTVVNADTGEPIPLRTLEGANVSINEVAYRAWKGFDVDDQTTVTVRVTATEPRHPHAEIAVGPEVTVGTIFGLMTGIGSSLAIAGAGLLAGVVVFLIVLSRRSSCKNRMRRADAAV